ncbi:MAG: hypothetical protein HY738_01060 [Bacteroidia bacterium]|nr:hypothetical protein [Bacteroidia bacterium]
MKNTNGINGIRPKINKISFIHKEKMNIFLEDGRVVIVPLKYFPEIQNLSLAQRKKWYISDDEMFSFDDCNEIFHIEQVLGKEQNYKYKFV